tara:strand:- start:396 stop:884 length:489 start_codon:yes stop_codon:yes gene_type:complete
MKGRGTPATSTQTAPALQNTDPIALDGCVECQDLNLAKIVFNGSLSGGSSADNKTMTGIELYGWSPLNGPDNLWLPSLIGKFEAVCGTAVGVGTTAIAATEYFADTITLQDGDESCRICSGIANRIASLTIDLEGAKRFQVVYTGAFGNAEVDNFNFVYSLI